MHILTTSSASLDDLVEPVDLRQTPADIVALSFTDSDLAGIAAAWKAEADACRRCGWPRCATCAIRCRSTSGSTASRRMPRSSWSASSAATTGGAMAATSSPRSLARSGIKLALLPGECRDEDLRLIECSTLPRDELDALLDYFREGGPANMSGAGAAAGGAGAGSETQLAAKAGRRCRRPGSTDPVAKAHAACTQAPAGRPERADADDPTPAARHPHPLLPLDAARRRCRADRRAVRGAARKGHAHPCRSSSPA